jgi:hypothetical protein
MVPGEENCKIYSYWDCRINPAGPSSWKDANSCGIIEFSSIVVQGLHMHPSGAFVDTCRLIKMHCVENLSKLKANANTFLNFRSPIFAFGQNRDTDASRSPDSWQQLQDLSICHILLPLTFNTQIMFFHRKLNIIIRITHLDVASTLSDASKRRYRFWNAARILKNMNYGC